MSVHAVARIDTGAMYRAGHLWRAESVTRRVELTLMRQMILAL